MEENRNGFEKIITPLKLIIIIIGILISTYLLITFVITRTIVDGNSMYPTLKNGDQLLVDKLTYKLKEPQRYDIIIFKQPYSRNGYYVKRIIGLPGEKVEIDDNGFIYINGSIIKDIYGYQKIEDAGMVRKSAGKYIIVPNDEYFVLGDNRNNSQDSRLLKIGTIHVSRIIGKSNLRIYPFQRFGYIDIYFSRRTQEQLLNEK